MTQREGTRQRAQALGARPSLLFPRGTQRGARLPPLWSPHFPFHRCALSLVRGGRSCEDRQNQPASHPISLLFSNPVPPTLPSSF